MLLFSDWRDFDERPGVYEIHFPNGLFYIGKSKNVRKRASEHIARLRRKAHNNPRMQAAFNKYKKVFFNVIQYCESDEEAIQSELRHIATHKSNKKCANVSSGDWVKDGDYVKYFSKPTLWVYLPTGLTHRTESRNEWGNLLGLACRWDNRKKIAVAMSRQHAMELHLDYWRDWLRQESAKLERKFERAQMQDRKKKEKQIKTWWYHMRNKNTGRVALARDTYELKRFKPCEGWERRRYKEQWPEAKQGTPPKPVIGCHPVLGEKRWPSIGACARSLNRSHVSVFKALRGTQRTCAGWTLMFVDENLGFEQKQLNLSTFERHGIYTTQAAAVTVGEGEGCIRGSGAGSTLLDCDVAESKGGAHAGAPDVPDVRATWHAGRPHRGGA